MGIEFSQGDKGGEQDFEGSEALSDELEELRQALVPAETIEELETLSEKATAHLRNLRKIMEYNGTVSDDVLMGSSEDLGYGAVARGYRFKYEGGGGTVNEESVVYVDARHVNISPGYGEVWPEELPKLSVLLSEKVTDGEETLELYVNSERVELDDSRLSPSFLEWLSGNNERLKPTFEEEEPTET